jgi:hypothetical protein
VLCSLTAVGRRDKFKYFEKYLSFELASLHAHGLRNCREKCGMKTFVQERNGTYFSKKSYFSLTCTPRNNVNGTNHLDIKVKNEEKSLLWLRHNWLSVARSLQKAA